MEVLMSAAKWFKWTVELQVHKIWVEDGFELTDERAHDLLANYLQYASVERRKSSLAHEKNLPQICAKYIATKNSCAPSATGGKS
jgi:hypothetical protein